MKKEAKVYMLLMGLLFMGMGADAQTETLKRMAIMSDVHLMAPELLKSEGKAFENYIVHDRKMLAQSPELLDSACTNVSKFHPQVILITGDLTKDGELVSHQLLVSRYLQPLKNQGIRVFVIPGIHDVNNPHAVVYDGDEAKRTTTVSIYHGCGDRFHRELSTPISLVGSRYEQWNAFHQDRTNP